MMQTPPSRRQRDVDDNAMNDTIKVNKSRSRVPEDDVRATSPALELPISEASSDMNDLSKV